MFWLSLTKHIARLFTYGPTCSSTKMSTRHFGLADLPDRTRSCQSKEEETINIDVNTMYLYKWMTIKKLINLTNDYLLTTYVLLINRVILGVSEFLGDLFLIYFSIWTCQTQGSGWRNEVFVGCTQEDGDLSFYSFPKA